MTTPTQDHSWAYALKPGDKAAIRSLGYYQEPYQILTFTRATTTLLIFNEKSVREKRVRKDNLSVMKGNCFIKIEPVTAEVIDANRRYRMIRELTDLREPDMQKLPTQYLAKMLDTLEDGRAAVAAAASAVAPM